MNQCLKDSVYNRGTKKQAVFMAEIGGMNEEETEVFLLIHSGKKGPGHHGCDGVESEIF